MCKKTIVSTFNWRKNGRDKVVTKSAFLIAALCALSPQSVLASNEFTIGYDSKYITEGRNNLQNGGIFWLSSSHLVSDHIVLTSGYGIALDERVSYDELNLGIMYENSVSAVNYSFSFTRLEFFKDDASDNEIGIDVNWLSESGFSPYISLVYSTEQSGYFTSLGVSKEYKVIDDLSFLPYVGVSFDNGYVIREGSGYNHVNVGATLVYSLSEYNSIHFKAEQSIGGTLVRNDFQANENVSWLGVHAVFLL